MHYGRVDDKTELLMVYVKIKGYAQALNIASNVHPLNSWMKKYKSFQAHQPTPFIRCNLTQQSIIRVEIPKIPKDSFSYMPILPCSSRFTPLSFS